MHMSSFIGIRNKNIRLRYFLNRHRRNREQTSLSDRPIDQILKLKKNGYATLQRYVKWCKRLYSHISVQEKYLSLYRTDITRKPGQSNAKRVAISKTRPLIRLTTLWKWLDNSFVNVSQPGRFATLFLSNRDAFLSN